MAKKGLSKNEKALLDACAGVGGSLLSLWLFYPFDVYKTQVQAGQPADDQLQKSCEQSKWPAQNFVTWLLHHSPAQWMAGCPMKTAHTTCSSFVYFYFYSRIHGWWTFLQDPPIHGGDGLSVPMRLILTAAAAVCNTFFTLPLDVVASRHQAVSIGESDHRSSLNNQQGSESESAQANGLNCKRNKSESEDCGVKERSINGGGASLDSESRGSIQQQRLPIVEMLRALLAWTRHRVRSRLAKVLTLWRGLVPALLLCSNPAIHYSVYDTLKFYILKSRTPTAKPKSKNSLSMSESFALGLVAKLAATIMTYPLIRAKVILMVRSEVADEDLDGQGCSGSPSGSQRGGYQSPTLLQCLMAEYQNHGLIQGLYRGCDLQLMHSLLKSALLMMIREAISTSLAQLFELVNVTTTAEHKAPSSR
jgi:Mitochondrial carrier protein